MKKLASGQWAAEFGNITIGGEAGENPTVLIGSVFYSGHDIIKDERSGEFDRMKAEDELSKCVAFSEKTGIPLIIDVISSYSESLIKWCEFIADYTNVPFLVDGVNHETRLAAIEKMHEGGFQDRAIYNCIDGVTSNETLDRIRELHVDKAIILCFDKMAITPDRKIKLLQGDGNSVGLIEKVEAAGIEDYVIDAGVIDIPSIGIAAETIKLIKSQLKLPAGCAPINAISVWPNRNLFGRGGYSATTSAVVSYLRESGADWLIYGSINKASMAFPGIAVTDNISAYVRSMYKRKKAKKTIFFNELR